MFLIEKLTHFATEHNIKLDPADHGPMPAIRSYALTFIEQIEHALKLEPRPDLLLGERARRFLDGSLDHPPGTVIVYDGLYSVELCRRYRKTMFVFGDNCLRAGKGGQAIIRDEPNAAGVATKRHPGEFMSDTVADIGVICEDLSRIESEMKRGVPHVIHVTKEGRISLGCGLAELPYRAPLAYALIEKWFAHICATYKVRKKL